MDFKQSVKTCLKKYASFDGCASRSELWWFILAVGAGGILSAILGAATGDDELLPAIYMMAFLLPVTGAIVRRLHDVNRSGLWLFVFAIPIVGLVILAVWLCQPASLGDNRYALPPGTMSIRSVATSGPTALQKSMADISQPDLDRLEKLHALLEKGVLTKDEFDTQKSALLKG
ncbi:MAG: DUF805 domain-containing protein [Caulobacteraceae bacterium]